MLNWELATDKIAALIGDHFFVEYDEDLAHLIVSNSRMWVIINTSPHSLSTAHGPARKVNVSGPIGTWCPGGPTQTVERCGWCWRLTSL